MGNYLHTFVLEKKTPHTGVDPGKLNERTHIEDDNVRYLPMNTRARVYNHRCLAYNEHDIGSYVMYSSTCTSIWVRSFSFPGSTPVCGVFFFQDERVQIITHVRPGKKNRHTPGSTQGS